MNSASSVTALIVDDSAGIRRAVRDVLGRLSECRVVGEAVNGLEALELVRRHQPILVIMDVNMPEMGGIEALRLLRSESPAVRVVMMSSEFEPVTRDLALGLGATACFEKGSDLWAGLPALVSTLSGRV